MNPPLIREATNSELASVQLLCCDVDGTLTDGIKQYSSKGLDGLRFSARDGLGLFLMLRIGVSVAWVTNSESEIMGKRASDIGDIVVHTGVEQKGAVVQSLRDELSEAARVLFIGDDIWDVPGFAAADFGVAVGDAHPDAMSKATHRTVHHGGHGAVREVCDAILNARCLTAIGVLNLDKPVGDRG